MAKESQSIDNEPSQSQPDKPPEFASNLERFEEETRREELPRGPSFYVFLSFDMVGSTALKQKFAYDPAKWSERIRGFYEAVQTAISGFRVWKFVGDEVVLFSAMPSAIRLLETLRVAEKLIEETFSSNQLSIKATAWTAGFAGEHNPAPHRASELRMNLRLPLREIMQSQPQSGFDFLGPDIDLGFRIGKHVPARMVGVSASLSYYLLTSEVGVSEPSEAEVRELIKKAGQEYLRLFDFAELKGVWESRPYPIVLYSQDWQSALSRTSYIDHQKLPNQFDSLSSPPDKHLRDKLKNIFADVGRLREEESLMSLMDEFLREDREETETSLAIPAHSGVHCVGIVILENRVLMRKRDSGKNVSPGTWDFGCAHHQLGETFVEAICREYHDRFGAYVDVLADQCVGIYETASVTSAPGKPGVILAALLKHRDFELTDESTKSEQSFDLIGGAQWVEISKVQAMKERELVPKGHEHLQKAIEIINQHQQSHSGAGVVDLPQGQSGV